MSKKANPVVIGGFVVGATVLTVIGLLLFGGGQVLSPREPYVLYFSGSVSGLNVGAGVNFRGVSIGTVTGVEVHLDVESTGVKTPVFIEIERNKFRTVGDVDEQDIDHMLDKLVGRGLRAKLVSESLVTGLKAVEFDFFPDSPVRLTDENSDPRELPTLPSEFEQIAAELSSLPIAELADSTQEVMQGLKSLISSPDIQGLPREVSVVLADLRTLLRNVDQRVGTLTSRLETTSGTANNTLHDVQALLKRVDEPVTSLAADLKKTSEATRGTLEQAELTLATLRDTVKGTSDLQYEMTITLREVSAAARALRQMAEALEQNPESLLRGRSGSRP